MKILCIGLTSVLWLTPLTAGAQPALDKLEDQVRKQVEQELPAPNDSQIGYLGVQADEQVPGGGVQIVKVQRGGPAEKGGLAAGDRVLRINEQPIDSLADFVAEMNLAAPGDRVTMSVEREGEGRRPETVELEITLGRRPPRGVRNRPPDDPIPDDFTPEDMPPDEGGPRTELLGVDLAPVTPQLQRLLRLPNAKGAFVVHVDAGSPAAKVRLPVEAVVVAIDAQPVDSPEGLADALRAAGPGASVRLAYYSKGKLFERDVVLGEEGEAPTLDEPPADPRLSLEARLLEMEGRVMQLEARVAELERPLKARED